MFLKCIFYIKKSFVTQLNDLRIYAIQTTLEKLRKYIIKKKSLII